MSDKSSDKGSVGSFRGVQPCRLLEGGYAVGHVTFFSFQKKVTKKRKGSTVCDLKRTAVNNLANAVNIVTKSVENSVYNSLIN